MVEVMTAVARAGPRSVPQPAVRSARSTALMVNRPSHVADTLPVVAAERSPEELLRQTLAAVAPGTTLRDGLERILRGRTGALIVLGYDRTVEDVCTGGFVLDVEFSATRLRELAKMDGAIVTDGDVGKILRAAVQLVPDSS